MQLIDLLEGVTFMRTSFHGDVFLDWLKQAKENPSLMALISGCLHHHGPGTDAGCGRTAATPLSSYPTPCCMALVRSQVLLAELSRRARSAGVQVMIEGPGHVPIQQVKTQIRLEKELTGEAAGGSRRRPAASCA